MVPARHRSELFRYLVNGGIATGVHFAVLYTNVELLHFESVGLANFVAAVFGSTAAFLGNRHLVFRSTTAGVRSQLPRFAGLYLAAATFHGLALFAWSDLLGWHYTSGFVVATLLQVVIGYLGNKLWVFKA